eukprot:EC795309.1.p1 GENE.EC795309.1~~EC795309.1.p1  ORF type:complete len:122 (+),score=25.02 EC795309.1:211-576(+)
MISGLWCFVDPQDTSRMTHTYISAAAVHVHVKEKKCAPVCLFSLCLWSRHCQMPFMEKNTRARTHTQRERKRERERARARARERGRVSGCNHIQTRMRIERKERVIDDAYTCIRFDDDDTQ